jgi:hypothetical protein
VFFPIGRGHEAVDVPPENLSGRIAEHPLG